MYKLGHKEGNHIFTLFRFCFVHTGEKKFRALQALWRKKLALSDEVLPWSWVPTQRGDKSRDTSMRFSHVKKNHQPRLQIQICYIQYQSESSNVLDCERETRELSNLTCRQADFALANKRFLSYSKALENPPELELFSLPYNPVGCWLC